MSQGEEWHVVCLAFTVRVDQWVSWLEIPKQCREVCWTPRQFYRALVVKRRQVKNAENLV